HTCRDHPKRNEQRTKVGDRPLDTAPTPAVSPDCNSPDAPPVALTQEDPMKQHLACSTLAVALVLTACDPTTTAPPLRPSFDVGGDGPSGNHYTIFLGCAHADQSGTAPDGWTSDAFSPSVIAGQLTSLLGFSAAEAADIVAGTVTSLAIVFDEGTDVGPGFVFLDYITVNAKTWMSPHDNGT